MEPVRRERRLDIAIPGSLVSDVPQQIERTSTVGLIGRAAAVFRVDEVTIYRDPNADDEDVSFIELILRYLDAPQYLRKKLFPLNPNLRYAGILHPLRTPYHPTKNKIRDLSIGDFREGIVLRSSEHYAEIDVGVEHALEVESRRAAPGSRVTIEVWATEPRLMGRIVDKGDVPLYWGYSVRTCGSLRDVFFSQHFDLSIATSRIGKPLLDVLDDVHQKWNAAGKVLVAFGSPKMGLREIAENEGLEVEKCFDFVVNTVPSQGSKTIRTEEAIYSSLSVFNLLMPD